MTQPKFKPEGPAEKKSQSMEETSDPLTALLAGLLLMMTCAKCNGSGEIEDPASEEVERCSCRDFGYDLSLAVLKDEGLIE